MYDTAQRVEHTIAVLSTAYLRAEYSVAEWAAAVARDPGTTDGARFPSWSPSVSQDGLLASIVHISLVGLAENVAREKLLTA